jgi:hypothetical protein
VLLDAQQKIIGKQVQLHSYSPLYEWQLENCNLHKHSVTKYFLSKMGTIQQPEICTNTETVSILQKQYSVVHHTSNIEIYPNCVEIYVNGLEPEPHKLQQSLS